MVIGHVLFGMVFGAFGGALALGLNAPFPAGLVAYSASGAMGFLVSVLCADILRARLVLARTR
ncbi:hypothetical protein [Roseibaca sp. Y0-43]|uniref:hypothetical protein n=1 Tax=Roseibaca sp. Y0-43 TaxID=2816854 RepID=UPI001D0C3D96|nr:hypothetical protein [Roseibaca sp. Y0-43]MCC1480483.1 hypothetical protein [Roseibaca sp. Y0-43]